MYHLVLEARPKEFMPIDINILLNNKQSVNYSSLMDIDRFTKAYTKSEIFDMIKESNIVPDNYLDGSLDIINDHKYRFGVITKDDDFSLDTFFNNYIDNKTILNKFMNVYIKYCSDTKEEMKKALLTKNVNNILNVLFQNSYEKVRSIYLYLYENIIKAN